METNGNSNLTRLAVGMARGLALMAGVFTLVVALLLAANQMAARNAPITAAPEIDALRAQLKQNPTDTAIRERIRLLDQLARRSYFTGITSTRTGILLLTGGVLVTLVSLRLLTVLRHRLPDPRLNAAAPDPVAAARAARWAVTAMAAVLAASAVAVSLLSKPEVPLHALASAPGRTMSPASTSPAPATVTAITSSVPRPTAVAAVSDEEIRRNWPCLRGPYGLGRAQAGDLPIHWDGAGMTNVLWKAPIPKPAFSSPIVWSNRLMLTGSDAQSREVYCFDPTSGQLLWTHSATGIVGSPSVLPEVTKDTGYAAPTMTTDGSQRYFALFATGDILCLDHCGTRLWARNLGTPTIRYGHSSSLVCHNGILFVVYDHDTGGRILGLDTATGNTIWNVPRKVDQNWSSPILVNTGSRVEVVVNGNPTVISHDPATGQPLWSFECMTGELAPSPAWGAGRVFVANEFAKLAAIVPGDSPVQAWESDEGLPNVSSPVADDRFVFMASGSGTLTCFDAKEGTLLWKQEVEEGFYSSPILAGDRVYAIDMSGRAYVYKAEAQYSLLSQSLLGEPCVATPAFMEGRIYIRGEKNLYCVGTGKSGGME